MIYFFNTGRAIILLHAFSKKTAKTPPREMQKAQNNMYEYLNNIKSQNYD
ncbi:hypothetical protein CL633_00985 [bacterium]|nr:hypothetical protein [bacterium]